MACRKARERQAAIQTETAVAAQPVAATTEVVQKTERLLFGVDAKTPAMDVLQNNITEFEWVVRNKLYPNFWGRNLTGEDCLTKKEIDFLHEQGCKVAALFEDAGEKQTEEQGKILAKKIDIAALELGIPEGTAIFLEIKEGENASRDFMKGYAAALLLEGYTPAFRANTDAMYAFDREFSRGLQTDREVFAQCLVWAVSPSLAEYERVTTTHLIHPDNWIPYAPSGITRNDIAIWQYGKNCHPIQDDAGKETTFNVNLVRNDRVIIEKMF